MKKLKKTLLIGLTAIGLLLIGLLIGCFPKSSIENASATTWTGLTQPQCVAIGDYDNDGLDDLAFSAGGNTVTVYRNDGTTIIKQWIALALPVGVAIGDYNNDGLNDIAIAENQAGRVTVYKSDGITVIKQWNGLGEAWGIAIGDYDNDGLNDIALTVHGGSGSVKVYKSDGTTIIKQWSISATGVAIGDFNNDGLNELAFAEQSTFSIRVYKSDGTTIIEQWLNSGLSGVAIGDYNNDGLNDAAIVDQGNVIKVYKSDGTTVIKQWSGLSTPYTLAIGDYNNDGLNDFAFTEFSAGRVTVYYQTEPGTVARVAEPTIVTLRGTLTNSSGYPIQSGSIRVSVNNSLGKQMWQDTFDDAIDDGRYNLLLGAKTTLMLIKGQIYSAVLEVDADSLTFVSADVIYGDNNPAGDIIMFTAPQRGG